MACHYPVLDEEELAIEVRVGDSFVIRSWTRSKSKWPWGLIQVVSICSALGTCMVRKGNRAYPMRINQIREQYKRYHPLDHP